MRLLVVLMMLVAMGGCRGQSPDVHVHSAVADRPDDPLFPSGVARFEIVHHGCLGPCPSYRVLVSNEGRFEYEPTRFVPDLGVVRGIIGPGETVGVFSWLQDHPEVHAVRPKSQLIVDSPTATYRFVLKGGKTIEFEVNERTGDDLWVLSGLADSIVAHGIWQAVRERPGGHGRPAT